MRGTVTRSGRRALRWLAVVLAMAGATGCFSFRPDPLPESALLERAVTETREGITVTVAVLDAAESRRYFGRDLPGKGIQPVWLRIVNGTGHGYWYMPKETDRRYYSPAEAAYMTQGWLSPSSRRRAEGFFRNRGLIDYIPPGATRSGFVFVTLDEGYKYVPVVLVRAGKTVRFDFELEVPGLDLDSGRIEVAGYGTGEGRERIDDDETLRRRLESLGCCTTDRSGKRHGDPLNLVLIGDGETLVTALVRARWDAVERMGLVTSLRTFHSALFGRPYRYSPVSSLYCFGRPQDVAFQKARRTVNVRNHMRLWLAPFSYRGTPVWVGQISRDIGVRFTAKTWHLTTHKIDADVDADRWYLIQDLYTAGAIVRLGFVKGVGRATVTEPRKNLTGDPYFTDGLRAVVLLSRERVPPGKSEFWPWEDPPTQPSYRRGELPE